MPRQKSPVNFDPETKVTSFRIPRQKPSQFRSLHWNRVKFHPPHWNQVKFVHPHKTQATFRAHTETKWFSARIQNQDNFDHPHKNQVNRSTHWKQVFFGPYTKTKSISILTLKAKSIPFHAFKSSDFRARTQKQRQFWLPHEKQVTFDPRTKTAI